MIVRRIAPPSLGKMLGAIYGALGLIGGMIISLVSVLGFAVGSVAKSDDVGNLAGLLSALAR